MPQINLLPLSTRSLIMNTWVVLLGVCTALVRPSASLYLSWDQHSNLTDNDIFIIGANLYVPGRNRISEKFKNLTRFPLDERCKRGMPLSISCGHHEPYSMLNPAPKSSGKGGVVFRGIFPGKLIT